MDGVPSHDCMSKFSIHRAIPAETWLHHQPIDPQRNSITAMWLTGNLTCSPMQREPWRLRLGVGNANSIADLRRNAGEFMPRTVRRTAAPRG